MSSWVEFGWVGLARFYDNCAEHYHGAWWFRSCFQSHLNGRYYMKVWVGLGQSGPVGSGGFLAGLGLFVLGCQIL